MKTKAQAQISVLIVEDVDEMRLMMEQLIGSIEGFRVSGSCSNVTEARLELTRRRPSLVLLDEVLPGESSLDFLRELAQEGIPAVLMTGVESPSHPLPPEARSRLMKPDWRFMDEARPQIEAQLRAAISQK